MLFNELLCEACPGSSWTKAQAGAARPGQHSTLSILKSCKWLIDLCRTPTLGRRPTCRRHILCTMQIILKNVFWKSVISRFHQSKIFKMVYNRLDVKSARFQCIYLGPNMVLSTICHALSSRVLRASKRMLCASWISSSV